MNKTEVQDLLAARRLAATGEGARLRQAAGLAQSEAAAACRVAQATLSRWESGQRRPRGKPAIRWVRLLRTLEQHADGTRGSTAA